LHRSAMVTKRHGDSESRSGLADSLVAALRNLPRGTDAGLRDSGTGSSGDRSVDMMMRLIDENYRLRDQLRAQGDQEQRSSERDRSRRRRSSPQRERSRQRTSTTSRTMTPGTMRMSRLARRTT
jgi:Spy/CpxP family protein refolding chaperone